jgi:hypothetical protein
MDRYPEAVFAAREARGVRGKPGSLLPTSNIGMVTEPAPNLYHRTGSFLATGKEGATQPRFSPC